LSSRAVRDNLVSSQRRNAGALCNSRAQTCFDAKKKDRQLSGCAALGEIDRAAAPSPACP